MKNVFEDISIVVIDIDCEMNLYSSGIDVMGFLEDDNSEGEN